jgi:hypothetical protein
MKKLIVIACMLVGIGAVISDEASNGAKGEVAGGLTTGIKGDDTNSSTERFAMGTSNRNDQRNDQQTEPTPAV